MILCLMALLGLAACGGGGTGLAESVNVAATGVTSSTAEVAGSPAATALPAQQPPSLPRAGLVAADLAVLIAAGDPLSEAIGLAYQKARGIPEANMVRVTVPAGSDVISANDFASQRSTFLHRSCKAGCACAFGHIVGVGVQVAHRLGNFGIGDFHHMVDVRHQYLQRRWVRQTAGHAIGQHSADRRLNHAACGYRVRIGSSMAADHAHNFHRAAQSQFGSNG